MLFGIVYIPPEYSPYTSLDAFSQIENEFLSLSSRYNNVALIGDFNSRTSTDSDFFNFDDKDPSNTLSDFVENSVNILDILGIPRIRENKDLKKTDMVLCCQIFAREITSLY